MVSDLRRQVWFGDFLTRSGKMNLYDSVLNYFRESKVALAHYFVPFFICSACNHVINLENQRREFFFEQGRVANLRIHIFFCSPPGYMKTLLLQKMLLGGLSVFGNSAVKTNFEGAMTEAAFTGTVRMGQNGQVATEFGAAHEHRESILGIDEFAILTNAMKMEHSINLDNVMLTALDSGYLVKRLALGKIQYLTQLTLWTGSQPARFDLTSGLGRRFLFMYFIPVKNERFEIKMARRHGKNIYPSSQTMGQMKRAISTVVDKCKGIQKIEFDEKIYTAIDKLNIPHFEEILYERLALGFCLATREKFDATFKVKMYPQLYIMFNRANEWRKDIKKGTEYSQIIKIIKDMGMCPLTDIKVELGNFGFTYKSATAALNSLHKLGLISYVKPDSVGSGRPTTLVVVNE